LNRRPGIRGRRWLIIAGIERMFAEEQPVIEGRARLKGALLRSLNNFLRSRGIELIRSELVCEWQRSPLPELRYDPTDLPDEARCYLRPNNPKLLELQKRYLAFDRSATTPLVWREGYVRANDIVSFRGENAYVWQLRGQNMNIAGYALTYFYMKTMDELGLLKSLREDSLFGIFTLCIDDQAISRDLLDSISEIYFLERHLKLSTLSNLRILDIGAGYGRLAHRMMEAFPNIENYLCTDAVAISTFVCDYYLHFRGLAGRAVVVPLDEIEVEVRERRVDLAVNIHSFSECSLVAINWWVDLLSRSGVRHIMIVPNGIDGSNGGCLLTNDKQDFQPVIERNGYKLIAKNPKYSDPIVQQYAIEPTFHYLFELQ
jgi:hypothetical protein